MTVKSFCSETFLFNMVNVFALHRFSWLLIDTRFYSCLYPSLITLLLQPRPALFSHYLLAYLREFLSTTTAINLSPREGWLASTLNHFELLSSFPILNFTQITITILRAGHIFIVHSENTRHGTIFSMHGTLPFIVRSEALVMKSLPWQFDSLHKFFL